MTPEGIFFLTVAILWGALALGMRLLFLTRPIRDAGLLVPDDAPVLPEGWQLAEHRRYGRVVVTNPATSGDGYVYCVFPTGRDGTGFDWHPYDPVALTYLDTEVHR